MPILNLIVTIFVKKCNVWNMEQVLIYKIVEKILTKFFLGSVGF